MALKRNDAFIGPHRTDTGETVQIFFVDGNTTRAFNRAQGTPIGHRNYRRSGWYWFPEPVHLRALGEAHGPFSSSRLAYQDAMRAPALAGVQ